MLRAIFRQGESAATAFFTVFVITCPGRFNGEVRHRLAVTFPRMRSAFAFQHRANALGVIAVERMPALSNADVVPSRGVGCLGRPQFSAGQCHDGRSGRRCRRGVRALVQNRRRCGGCGTHGGGKQGIHCVNVMAVNPRKLAYQLRFSLRAVGQRAAPAGLERILSSCPCAIMPRNSLRCGRRRLRAIYASSGSRGEGIGYRWCLSCKHYSFTSRHTGSSGF